MNIFVTSSCPVECAKYLDDKRVNKMATETAQMLSTCLANYYDHVEKVLVGYKKVKGKDKPMYHYFINGIRIYGPSHNNHPCNVWARKTYENFYWLWEHGIALCDEYRNRTGKIHGTSEIYDNITKLDSVIPMSEQTPFANCAANDSKGVSYKHIDDVYTAYRLYLSDRWKTDKLIPKWYGKAINEKAP